LVWLAAQEQNLIPSLGRFVDPVLSWIGTRSFGIYLVHLPAFQFAGELTFRFSRFDTALCRTIIALAVIAVAVEFSYRWVEAPIRERRQAAFVGPRRLQGLAIPRSA
jgi:peptidoglycan/LPS O-acetylase OafA/YrhL